MSMKKIKQKTKDTTWKGNDDAEWVECRWWKTGLVLQQQHVQIREYYFHE